MGMKYIIVNRAFPVIFHPGIEHVVEAAGRKISSAGHVSVNEDGELYCHGRSESLNIDSNPDLDIKLIDAMFGIV